MNHMYLSPAAARMKGMVRPFLGRRNTPARTASAERVFLDLKNGAFKRQRIA